MKNLLITCLILASLMSATAASAETRGWGAGIGVYDGDFTIQARKDFWLGGDISQITGQAGVGFHGKTTFRLDVDYHFIVNPQSPSRFYPLGGIDFAFNSDAAKLGLNLGGGANFMLTETMAAFVELKYVLGDWDGFAITAGIYF